MSRNDSTIIKGGLLIDGNGGEPIANPVVVISGKKIEAVGPAGSIEEPADATVIDIGNRTILPGLFDCHIHLAAFNCDTFHNYRVSFWEVSPQLQSFYALYHAQLCLEQGFTTLRDMGRGTHKGSFATEMCSVRDAINAGIVPGPRILVGGRVMVSGSHFDLLTMPRAVSRPPDFTADGPYELRRHVRENLRTGCDLIKTCCSGGVATHASHGVRNMTQEELDAVVDEAHAFNKKCSVHVFTADGQRMCVKAGVDTIEHMVLTDDDATARIVDAGTYVIPTLSHRSDKGIELREKAGAPGNLIRRMKELQPRCFETFHKMRDSGVKMAMGTDTGIDPKMGESAYELSIYVELGMSPMEAIQTATKNAAEALGLLDELGTLEAGKFADIVVVDGNPLEDIQILEDKKNINLVMKEGQIFIDKIGGNKNYLVLPEPDALNKIDML